MNIKDIDISQLFNPLQMEAGSSLEKHQVQVNYINGLLRKWGLKYKLTCGRDEDVNSENYGEIYWTVNRI